jgi:hypothetical protein
VTVWALLPCARSGSWVSATIKTFNMPRSISEKNQRLAAVTDHSNIKALTKMAAFSRALLRATLTDWSLRWVQPSSADATAHPLSDNVVITYRRGRESGRDGPGKSPLSKPVEWAHGESRKVAVAYPRSGVSRSLMRQNGACACMERSLGKCRRLHRIVALTSKARRRGVPSSPNLNRAAMVVPPSIIACETLVRCGELRRAPALAHA